MAKSDEQTYYEDILCYLKHGTYREELTKNEKRGIRKRSKDVVTHQGLLYVKDAAGHERQWIADPTRQRDILQACHDDKAGGGHFGRDKTLQKISSRFYWKNLTNAVKEYVQTCHVCQKVNSTLTKQPSALRPIPVEPAVWHQVGLDIVGPFTKTTQGNMYLITCTDYFSKWPEAKAVPNKDATTVAKFLYSLILRLGCFVTCITDQGREFVNALNRRLFMLSGTQHRISSAYHPQTNGLDERMNQTITKQLLKYINDQENDWDEHLEEFLFSYRTSVHASTRYTPFYIMFGREAILPIQLQERDISDDVTRPSDGDSATKPQGCDSITGPPDSTSDTEPPDGDNATGPPDDNDSVTEPPDGDNATGPPDDNDSITEPPDGDNATGPSDDNDNITGSPDGDSATGPPDGDSDKGLCTLAERLEHLKEMKSTLFDNAMKNIKVAQARQKKNYDRHNTSVTFQVGQMVLVKNLRNSHRMGGKLEERWLGPYKITGRTKRDLYTLENKSGKPLKKAVNSCRLKNYHERKSTSTLPPFATSTAIPSLVRAVTSSSVAGPWSETTITPSFVTGPLSTKHNTGAMETVDGDVVQVKDSRDECTGKDYVAKEKTDGRLKVIDLIEDSREEGVKEDCEVELVHDGKVENGGEEGVAVVENANGCDAVRDDNKERDAGKEKDDEQRQQCTVSICEKGKGSKNEQRKGMVYGVRKRKSNALQNTIMKRRRIPSLSRKSILQVLDGDMLTDEHISFAQNVLQEQFPTLDGLQSPLLSQTNAFSPVIAESVQIHHTGSCHWVTSTSIGREVHVYDSKFKGGKLSASLQIQLASVYKLCTEVSPDGDHTLLPVKMPSVQQQRGYTSCGLFAIAFAFHAARGDDLTQIEFHQDKMRDHLAKCFRNKHFTPFPHSRLVKGYRQDHPLDHVVHLYCDCDMPEGYDNMVACDACHQWFHKGCVGFQPQAKSASWFCKYCNS